MLGELTMDEIEFLEKYFGIKLLWYQKVLLRAKLKYNKIVCSRGSTKTFSSLLLNSSRGEEDDTKN